MTKEKKRKRGVFEVLSVFFFVLGLSLLGSIFFLIFTSHLGFAGKLANFSFFLLVLGSLFYLLTLAYDNKN
jgi:FtsH-binding integral membrane protein